MSGKILLVEDNDNNRYLAHFLLKREGFSVTAVTTGLQALETLGDIGKEAPDLILMDIQMPEMDGYETAQRIKSHPSTAHIPIVGISSFAMASDRERALREGFVGYLEKPIDPHTFARQVGEYLKPERRA